MSANFDSAPFWGEVEPSGIDNIDLNNSAAFDWCNPIGIIGAEVVKLAPVIDIRAGNNVPTEYLPELIPTTNAL